MKKFKKYNEWVNFPHLQLRSVKCKIKKKNISRIFLLEKKIEEYIGEKFTSIIKFFNYRGKNREIY